MRTLQYFILATFLFYGTASAQDAELNRILSAREDTANANRLSLYIQKHLRQDPQTAERLAHRLFQISTRLKYEHGLADALAFLGQFDYSKANFRKSIAQTFQAIQYYQRSNDTLGISKCYGNLAVQYEAINNNDTAMVYRMKAIRLIEKKRPSLLAKHYHNLAVQFNNRMDNAPKAIFYFRKAEELASETKDSAMLVAAWSGISHVLNGEMKFSESYVYARKAIEMSKGSKDYAVVSLVYENYSNILMELNQLDSAVFAAKKGIQYAETAGYNEGYIINYIRLSKVLKKKGDHLQQKIALEKALEKIRKYPSAQHYSFIYEELSAANYSLANYKKAYDYRLLANSYADSNRNERDAHIFAELETKYQTSLKEKALAQKDLQLHKNRNYMYYSLIALVVALLVAGILYIQYRHKKMVHAKEIKTIQQQKELQLLQALMQGEEKERSRIAKDLHDGVAGMLAAVKMHFSSMPAADDLLHTEGYRQGMKLLNDAAQEIRKTSHNLMPEVLLQHGLDEALRRYCSSLNNSRTLQVQYDSWGEVDRFIDSFELSVYRIVQELVNNIIKHSKASQAIVQLTQQNGVLSISIEDNGVGFGKEEQEEGMGLRSLQSRIKAMNGKIEMQVSEQSGVSAYLEFEVTELTKEMEHAYE